MNYQDLNQNKTSKLPYSKEIESEVIAAMLSSLTAAKDIIMRIEKAEWREVIRTDSDPADVFYIVEHKHIYRAIVDLLTGYSPKQPDIVTVVEQLKKNGTLDYSGGASYLAEIQQGYTYSNYTQHLLVLLEYHIRRTIIQLSTRMQSDAINMQSDALATLNETMNDLNTLMRTITTGNELTGKQLVAEGLRYLETIRSGNIVKTGFKSLDEKIIGFAPEDYVVIGGRPSVGKTAFALSMATNMISDGKKICFISMEMSAATILLRLASALTKMSVAEMRADASIASKWDTLKLAEWLDGKFFYDRGEVNDINIVSRIRYYKEKYDVDVVMIDYLQLMQTATNAGNMNERMTRISRSVKQAARINQIPIIALSQLNRDSEKVKDADPKMSELRDSGSLEQDADFVIFPHRPKATITDGAGNSWEGRGDVVEIIIDKNRNGEVGKINEGVKFIQQLAQFVNTNDKIKKAPLMSGVELDIDF